MIKVNIDVINKEYNPRINISCISNVSKIILLDLDMTELT
tara:strand:+ start:5653 stop:5772 length:120 start_codon:yes stop_codon:yes gene_type:complete